MKHRQTLGSPSRQEVEPKRPSRRAGSELDGAVEGAWDRLLEGFAHLSDSLPRQPLDPGSDQHQAQTVRVLRLTSWWAIDGARESAPVAAGASIVALASSEQASSPASVRLFPPAELCVSCVHARRLHYRTSRSIGRTSLSI